MTITRNLIPGLIVALTVIIGGTIYFKYDTARKDKIIEQLKAEYPAITTQQELQGIITDIDHGDPKIFRNNPHQAYIVLNDSLKKRISASSEMITDTLLLDDILHIGDWLIKKPNSDKFFIYKIHNNDTLKYRFELNDDLGYPLKEHKN